MLIKSTSVAERKTIRAITGAKYNESVSPLVRITGDRVLKLSVMLQVSMLQYMYRFVKDDLPATLLETSPIRGGGGLVSCHRK